VGGVVSATTSRLETANSMHEAALRADAEKTSVDLDEEAANLLAQQQAYQANAQVMSVARSLFDTLLNSL
jgi:flagellar hook-associated protein 1 FlgK